MLIIVYFFPKAPQNDFNYKKTIVITATCLFIVAFCIGENVYRNIIIIGISLEAVMILPIMKIIIQ